MFTGAELKRLEEARQLLMLQAEVHRQLIRLEVATCRAPLGSLRQTAGTWLLGRPWLLVAAVAGGILAVRNCGVCRWILTAFGLFQWLCKLF